MNLPRHEAKLHLSLFHQAIAEAAKRPTEERCNKRPFVHEENSVGMPGHSKTAQLPKHVLGCSGKIKMPRLHSTAQKILIKSHLTQSFKIKKGLRR